MLKPKQASKRQTSFISKVTYLSVLLFLLTPTVAVFSHNAVSQARADSSSVSEYSQDQIEALDFLNSVRAKVGVPPVKLNAAITRAAESHALYYNYNVNKSELPDLKTHSEINGTPGFTGKNVKDRLTKAGYKSSNRDFLYAEVIHFQQKSSSDAMQAWMDTAYHRQIVLDPDFDEIGIALVDGTVVADFSQSGTGSVGEGSLAVYPYDQQNDVPVGFYGHETPNPLDQFQAEFSGYIISATSTATDIINDYQVEIKDNQGNDIPYYEELYDKTLYIYPESILKGNHTYTVSLTYSTRNRSETNSKVWSFTTGEGHHLASIRPFTDEITLNQDEQQQLNWISHYDDGAFDEEIEGFLRYISSNDTGLRISATGMITAIKPGDYTIKATLEGKAALVNIKVYPKWKTKNYNIVSKKLPPDSIGHPLLAAIKWGLNSAIVTPTSNGKLQPNATVSEAEFWIMLLKTYRVNIASYQSTNKTLVDTTYQIAKDRNYPLTGITKKEYRNRPISRQKIAEIISAADGKHFRDTNAIHYVLAKDYIRGITELSYSGYKGSRTVTKAEALAILKYLHGSLDSLKGSPLKPTDISTLPEMPERELYIKPVTYENYTFFAQYRSDGRLVMEGKFLSLKGQRVVIQVQHI
ncbi:CAP domain-containing protein [Paenibacillus amylolyticus]|uniref:CAP domain-containing protein n=1 Tax=Paenibacillus amylolyticus TaxID=1451 RepID=UPI003EBDDACD